jgi:hypothetical protein
MEILVFVVVYLLSAYAEYKWIQIAYSTGGKYAGRTLVDMSTIVMWVPIWNTIWAILAWTISYPRQVLKRDLNKFFKIK